VVNREGFERRRLFESWYEHMGQHGITAVEADAHFAQWAEEDHYVPLPDELGLLAEAGFRRPECFWRDAGLTVYGGVEEAPNSPPVAGKTSFWGGPESTGGGGGRGPPPPARPGGRGSPPDNGRG